MDLPQLDLPPLDLPLSLRILSDEPPTPLHEAASMLSQACPPSREGMTPGRSQQSVIADPFAVDPFVVDAFVVDPFVVDIPSYSSGSLCLTPDLVQAFAVLGVHGAGWANLVFAGEGAHAIEMALPEPHAIYAAHTAYALGIEYWHIPLAGSSLHSARYVSAPTTRVSRVLRRVIGRQREALAMGREVGADEREWAAPSQASPPTTSSVELVVARYQEDVDWCRRSNCTVYNKGPRLNTTQTEGVRYLELPNIGRESHTWLTHIVERWDTLAETTVFMQGERTLQPLEHLAAQASAAPGGASRSFPIPSKPRSNLVPTSFQPPSNPPPSPLQAPPIPSNPH